MLTKATDGNGYTGRHTYEFTLFLSDICFVLPTPYARNCPKSFVYKCLDSPICLCHKLSYPNKRMDTSLTGKTEAVPNMIQSLLMRPSQVLFDLFIELHINSSSSEQAIQYIPSFDIALRAFFSLRLCLALDTSSSGSPAAAATWVMDNKTLTNNMATFISVYMVTTYIHCPI